MRNRLVFFLAFITATTTALAQATQPCIVKQYNQKKTKTPLGGVQVEVRDAGTGISAANGTMTLKFTTLKPGDRVTLRRITKAGYEIFNKTAIDQWIISRNQQRFEIVLVRSDYFTQLKNNLTQSSTDNYKAKYEKAKSDLAKLQKTGKLKEAEYRRQLNALEDQYDNALKNLDNYIDQFARIDVSEVSTEEQHILDLVQAGQIDEAVKAYEKLNISKKRKQVRDNIKALEEAESKIKNEKQQQLQAYERLKAMERREIATLKLAGGKENYDKVACRLKENAVADTKDIDAVWDYAEFAYEQKDFKEAELYWLICLKDCEYDVNKQTAIQNNLGNLYSDMHEYDKAEEYYLKALENKNRLFAENPDALRASLASTQDNLGVLYYDTHNYDKSEEYHLKALENRTQLFNQEPEAYRSDLAITQNNLANLYRNTHDYAKAEEYYLQALDNKNQLFSQNADAYRADLAGTQNNLGTLYYSIHDYAKAEEFYLKALENKTRLFDQNPDAYRSTLASTQNNLGALYFNIRDYAKAESYHLKALENRTYLFNHNPEAYRADLAMTQNNLGSLYKSIQNYGKAEEFHLKALENYTRLFSQSPEVYRAELAGTQNDLGMLYYITRDYAKAEDYFLKALENRSQLFAQNPDAYCADMAMTHNNLGVLYDDVHNYAKAEEHYLKALDNTTMLFAQNSEAYRSALAMAQNNLGLLYKNTRNYPKAEEFFQKAVENKDILFTQNPDAYRVDLASTLFNLSLTHAFMGEYPKALEAIDRAITLYPDNANYQKAKELIIEIRDKK